MREDGVSDEIEIYFWTLKEKSSVESKKNDSKATTGVNVVSCRRTAVSTVLASEALEMKEGKEYRFDKSRFQDKLPRIVSVDDPVSILGQRIRVEYQDEKSRKKRFIEGTINVTLTLTLTLNLTLIGYRKGL